MADVRVEVKWGTLPWRGPNDLPLPFCYAFRKEILIDRYTQQQPDRTTYRNQTLDDLGWQWGISGERVRQILDPSVRAKATGRA